LVQLTTLGSTGTTSLGSAAVAAGDMGGAGLIVTRVGGFGSSGGLLIQRSGWRA